MIHFSDTHKNATLPDNCGKIWYQQEEQKLLDLIKHNKTLDEIALEHKRTAGGIRSRLCVIARKLYKTCNNIEMIQKKLKLISIEDIQKAIKYTKPAKKILQNDIVEGLHELNETLRMLLFIEIKKNNIDMTDFWLDSHTEYDTEIQLSSTTTTEHNAKSQISDTPTSPVKFIETRFDELGKITALHVAECDMQCVKHNEYAFDDKMLDKMTMHLDDKSKLKKLRRKNGIAYDVFYSKVEELKKNKTLNIIYLHVSNAYTFICVYA